MSKRLGSDPFGWIQNSRPEAVIVKQVDAPEKPTPTKEKIAAPKRRRITKSTQEGLRQGWTRATFIVREDHLDKIKALAYWERKQIKEVIAEMIDSFLDGKQIEPIPKKGDK